MRQPQHQEHRDDAYNHGRIEVLVHGRRLRDVRLVTCVRGGAEGRSGVIPGVAPTAENQEDDLPRALRVDGARASTRKYSTKSPTVERMPNMAMPNGLYMTMSVT